ncbi:hypothetical protein ECC02_002327 [Trypanosoma cruzi]|uniref:Uncharacterized protein n=1 Tax=Trypanosoma cruzi TaxID=5693 RepID=A0A7J6YE51_TRYCR|nr:hypothetical protein ECC02_002327 [Trypanosoma cruzi]
MLIQMISFLAIVFLFLPLNCDAVLLLESVGRSLNFTRQASREAQSVVFRTDVSRLLDWHVVRGAQGLQLRVALLLRFESSTPSENTGPFLAVMDEIFIQCLYAPISLNNADDAVSVIFSTSHATVYILYPCGYDDASASLHMLAAHWRDGNLSVTSDEPVLSLGVAKRWLLSHDSGGADAQLLYIQGLDGVTSAILLEKGDPFGVYPSSISRLKFPPKSTMRDTELVSSCFLHNVGVSGLVRHSRLEETFYFELYRIFSSKQSAELLLETSTTIFTDLDSEERRHCSLSSRVAFTGCSLTFSSAPALQVEITLTAMLESPTASGLREIGGWVRCGTTVLKGRAEIKDGGLHVLVLPLRRVQFKPAAEMEGVREEGEHTRGRLGHCTFHHSNDTLDCDGGEEPVCSCRCGVSRHCLALQLWWRPSTGVDLFFCDWLGMGLFEGFAFVFVLFTVTFVIHFATRLLLLHRHFFFFFLGLNRLF